MADAVRGQKVLYDIQTTVIYKGVAMRGTREDAPRWTITRITFTNGNPSASEVSSITARWDQRTTETYT